MLAAGTGFTDTLIRRGRYPDFKGPLPFTPGYDLVGVVEKTGAGVPAQLKGELVADLCVVGGYAQYAIRPARFLVPVPDSVDPAEAVCIPLAYLTAFQMLTRYRRLPSRRHYSRYWRFWHGRNGVARSGAPSRPQGDRHVLGHQLAVVERFGATAIDYRAGDFVAAVRGLTAGRKGGAGVDAAFDAIGGAHFGRSLLASRPAGCSSATGRRQWRLAARLGCQRRSAWRGSSCGAQLSRLFGGRSAVFYSITARRMAHPEDFKADMATLFDLLRDRRHPSRRDRPSASRSRERGPCPHRCGRTRREDRAATLVCNRPKPASSPNHTRERRHSLSLTVRYWAAPRSAAGRVPA